VASKYAAAMLSARMLGMSRDEGRLIFGLTINQAAATLAAALVGYRIGLLDETVLNGTVMMILVTCILGPWMTQRFGRRVAQTQQAAPHPMHGPQIERVLVPLSSPRTTERLIDLSFLLRGAHHAQPVYALHVVSEEAGVEAGINEADRVLAAAVIRGSAAGVAVQGVTRIEANPATGILRAARELRATTLVLGWSDQSPARALLFRSLLARLLEGTRRQTVVICRAPHPLATVRRVVVVVPPLMERHDGAGSALRMVVRLASRIGATVHVWVCEQGKQPLQAIAAAEKIRVDGAWVAYDDWNDILGSLARHTTDADMLILIGPRNGQLAWSRSVERLPSLLARQFTAHNAAVIYPPDVDDEPADAGPPAHRKEERMAFDLKRIWQRCASDALTAGSGSVSTVIAALVRRRFGDGHEAERVVRALTGNEAVEVVPGVLLLHAHIDQFEEAALLLATGHFEHADGTPIRVVLLLASPLDSPPEQHLRLLAAIAHLAQNKQRLDRIATAGDPAILQAVLLPGEAGSS